MNEADTCRQHVVPKLQAAGWDDDPHSIAEQRTITDGRIVPQGQGFIRKPPKRVDYLLCYRRDFPLAVVEAKAAYKHDLHKRKAPVFFPSLDKEGWRGAPGWFEYSARSLLLEICID